MKYYSILFIAILGIFSSCTEEEPETFIDFSGTYLLEVNCEGPMGDENGAIYPVTIEKSTLGGQYTIDFGDEVVFQAEQFENTLSIPNQTINEEFGFDVVTLEGEMRFEGEDYILDVEQSVDDEGKSICSFPMVKQ